MVSTGGAARVEDIGNAEGKRRDDQPLYMSSGVFSFANLKISTQSVDSQGSSGIIPDEEKSQSAGSSKEAGVPATKQGGRIESDPRPPKNNS
jgi:hypothetical protein